MYDANRIQITYAVYSQQIYHISKTASGVIDGSPKFQHQAAVNDCFVSALKSLLLSVTDLGSKLLSHALKVVIYVVLDVTKKMTVSKSRKLINIGELGQADRDHALVTYCLHIAIHLKGIMGRISESFIWASPMLPFLLNGVCIEKNRKIQQQFSMFLWLDTLIWAVDVEKNV